MLHRQVDRSAVRLGSVGAPVVRLEDHRLVTGTGQYTDDVDADDALAAVFVRSQHAHALIKSIDKTFAEKAGDVLIITAEDLTAAGV